MRGLAEFVMRGRLQALSVCAVFALLPLTQWLAAAVLALVTLRRGLTESALVLGAALVPLALLYAISADISTTLLLLSVAGVALVLRATTSWEMALVAIVAASVVSGLMFELFAQDVISSLVDVLVKSGFDFRGIESATLQVYLPGVLALGQAYTLVAALLLGRWWQSTLYNPGGFGAELHQVRLSPLVCVVLVGLMLALAGIGGAGFTRWIPVLSVPMVVAAFSLVHFLVKAKGQSTGVLVAVYGVFVLIVQISFPLMASLAIMDSWMNFRKRMKADNSDEV